MNLSCGECSDSPQTAAFSRADPGEAVAQLQGVRAILPALALMAIAVVALPSRAFAVTIDQVISLTKSGVSETVILGLIERDQTVLAIAPEDLVALKRAGVSDTVVVALLKSGREAADAAVKAQADANASSVAAALSIAPTVVIVGHGPDRPNAPENDAAFAEVLPAPPGTPGTPGTYVPYAVPVILPSRAGHHRAVRRPVQPGLPADLPPSSFVAVPSATSGRGMFFTDDGGPARGMFFSGK